MPVGGLAPAPALPALPGPPAFDIALEPEPAAEPEFAPAPLTSFVPAPLPASAFEPQPPTTSKQKARFSVAERGLKGMLRVMLSLQRALRVRLLARPRRNPLLDGPVQKFPVRRSVAQCALRRIRLRSAGPDALSEQ